MNTLHQLLNFVIATGAIVAITLLIKIAAM